jgi:hypothetical protein
MFAKYFNMDGSISYLYSLLPVVSQRCCAMSVLPADMQTGIQ